MSSPFPDEFAIDLPDLDIETDNEIVPDNLLAVQSLYFAAMLEQAKVFRVADRLAQLFFEGMLPVGGNAGKKLYRYWRDSSGRLNEVERRSIYWRTLGIPGGASSGVAGNTAFQDLWLRFVSSVSAIARQTEPDDVLQNQARQFALDLARNLSLHGYGVAQFAAAELQQQIREIVDILSEPEIKSAYGARDMWQVVDRVSTLDGFGPAKIPRHRAMATSASTIIRWLAANRDRLSGGSCQFIQPSDGDLIKACESWLAAASVGDGD